MSERETVLAYLAEQAALWRANPSGDEGQIADLTRSLEIDRLISNIKGGSVSSYPEPTDVSAAAARLWAWLEADDASHFGQHEKDIATVLAALTGRN